MKILAIETSCDETSIAIVQDGCFILSNVVSSQIRAHQKFGGVVPELASRMHVEKINILLELALKEAQLPIDSIDACAVTIGPGLEGALLVGLTMAKTIAVLRKIPFIGVNHLHGHLYAQFLTETLPTFPCIALIVSGGHTLLIKVNNQFDFEVLGSTRDDAVGEAFDKIARFLDLGYPGGPIVEATAKEGNSLKFKFPQPMLKKGFEFSFSGLKTAVIQTVIKLRESGNPIPVEDICASFQHAVVNVLCQKALLACERHGIDTLLISGGVSANGCLRQTLEAACSSKDIRFLAPPLKLCTDNAAMIGAAAFYQYQRFGETSLTTQVNPNLEI